MKINHHFKTEQDIDSIAAMACVCLAAIHERQSGKPVYIGALIRSLAAAPTQGTAG